MDDDAMHPIWYLVMGAILIAIGIASAAYTWHDYVHNYRAHGKIGVMGWRGAEYPVHFVMLVSFVPGIAGIVLIWRGAVLIREILQQT
jgi:hypothetical protein